MRRLACAYAIAALVLASPNAVRAQSTETILTTKTFVDVAKKSLPSVVSISVRNAEVSKMLDPADPMYDDFMQFMARFGNQGDPSSIHTSSGSGFIATVDGNKAYIVTNSHVIARAETEEMLSVTLDGSVIAPTAPDAMIATVPIRIDYGNVKIMGRDDLSDLALLEFDVPEGVVLSPLEFADSDKLEVGEWVVALGNPLEFNNSVSQGIVSGKGRYLGSSVTIANLLQTTATINPGNSGGPLVNLDGRVVGLNNAIASNNGYWQGIGFAIPSKDVMRIAEQLRSNGKVERGYLGISMQPLASRPALARKYEITDYSGVLVGEVMRDTPADHAGFVPGDVITAVDGGRTSTTDDLLKAIAARAVGATAKFDVVRLDEAGNVQRITIATLLTARPTEPDLASPKPKAPELELPDESVMDQLSELGIKAGERTGEKGKAGVILEEVQPNTAAFAAGLKEGDIVLRANGRRIKTKDDFEKALRLSKDGSHMLTYDRDGSNMFATIQAE